MSSHSSFQALSLGHNKYRNYTVGDNLSYQRGNHQFKGGFLFAWESKDELSGSGTQGSFSFGVAMKVSRAAAITPGDRLICCIRSRR